MGKFDENTLSDLLCSDISHLVNCIPVSDKACYPPPCSIKVQL